MVLDQNIYFAITILHAELVNRLVCLRVSFSKHNHSLKIWTNFKCYGKNYQRIKNKQKLNNF